jgi:hypothetical protein
MLVLQDRLDGSQLLNKTSRHDENTQPEQHAQSLKPQTWQTASASSWAAGTQGESGARDEYGFPQAEASINTHEFPSLTATAKQPTASKHFRPHADPVCPLK